MSRTLNGKLTGAAARGEQLDNLNDAMNAKPGAVCVACKQTDPAPWHAKNGVCVNCQQSKHLLTAGREIRHTPPTTENDEGDIEMLTERRAQIGSDLNELAIDPNSLAFINAMAELLDIDKDLAKFEQIGDARLTQKFGTSL